MITSKVTTESGANEGEAGGSGDSEQHSERLGFF